MSRRSAYLACILLSLPIAASLDGCQGSSVGYVNLYSYGAAPLGINNVVLAIRSFELGGYGTHITINPNLPTDITVDLASGRSLIMPGMTVPTGYYKWVKLDIDQADSYVIAANGNRYALDVPSVYESDGQYLVRETVTADLAVDVDLRRGLTTTTQNGVTVYTLKPVSQLVTLEDAGEILGAVFPTTLIGSRPASDPGCDPQVYVFPGANVTPEGYDVPVPGGTAPLTSATPVLRLPADIYVYQAELLPVGHYTVAATCAALDTPGATSLAFTPTVTVKVSAQGQASASF